MNRKPHPGRGPMSRLILPGLAFLCIALGGARFAGGHHSLSAEFDLERTVELTGVVTKVEWTNPHTYIYIDVRSDTGSTERWTWELASPNGLQRQGWTPRSVRVGDQITANGTPARDGSRKANTRSVVLGDGQLLSVALGDQQELNATSSSPGR